MTKPPIKDNTFSVRVKNRLITMRLGFLKRILRAAGIREYREHLVYVGDLDPDSVVIDLGANEGLFSKEIHQLCGCKCFVIEPNSRLYEHINGDFITKFCCAITSVDGPIDFYISNNKEASSIIKDFETEWGMQEKQTIEGLSLPTFMKRLDLGDKDVEILKVDIEGAELDVIESLTANDVRRIKQITIEFHDWLNMELHGRTVRAINKLVSLGFDAYSHTPGHDWPVEMLFLNRRLVQLTPRTKFFLSVFRSTAFLKY
jgi:FkbM family methyltransferase